ncbi:MAG: hypothetical protein NDF52_06100 [archaeon YNP-WB-062]|nr:hypothetical protein [Candidatus Culexarchaeum yellowstonense]
MKDKNIFLKLSTRDISGDIISLINVITQMKLKDVESTDSNNRVFSTSLKSKFKCLSEWKRLERVTGLVFNIALRSRQLRKLIEPLKTEYRRAATKTMFTK